MWLQGQGFPKSQDIGKRIAKKRGEELKVLGKNPNHREPNALYKLGFQGGKGDGLLTEAQNEWSGWGNALKPAWECIIMARKPFKGSLTNNVLEHGTGAINIDACRIGSDVMKEQVVKAGKQTTGWNREHSYVSPKKTGRFPANVIISHSAGCRVVGETTDTRSGGERTKTCHSNKEPIPGGEGSGGTMREESKVLVYDCVDGCPVKELDRQAPKAGNVAKVKRKKDTTGGSGDSWSHKGKKAGEDNGFYDGLSGASRFFYQPKISMKERNAGGVKNNHPTVKPIALMKWLVKLVSKKGQIVFDPFVGSGSTGIACAQLDRDFVGTDLNSEYCDIAKKRIIYHKNLKAKLDENENKK
mgnify:CR=1 FL=1